MNKNRLNEVIAALNKRKVSQPCPRCSSSNFSVVGESEIIVTQPPTGGGLLGGLSAVSTKTTMPIIIVACDNCGYISQHAQAALGLLPRPALGLGLGMFRGLEER